MSGVALLYNARELPESRLMTWKGEEKSSIELY